MAKDPWSVLGVPEGADGKTIKRAFRTLAREHHPDRSSAPGAEERFRELVAAYELLSGSPARPREPHGDASAIHAFYAWLAGREAAPAPDDPAEAEPPSSPPRRRESGIRAAAILALLYAVALLVLLLTR